MPDPTMGNIFLSLLMQSTAGLKSKTIDLLLSVFSVRGFPRIIVSDNASIFTSDVFKQFCLANGIRQKFTASGHPCANGLAERNVQTLKNRLKAMERDPLPLYKQLQKIMMIHRASPLADNKSPAENRNIRIRLDAIKPFTVSPRSTIVPGTRQLKLALASNPDSIQTPDLNGTWAPS